MPLSVKFNDCIDKINILKPATVKIGNYLDSHLNCYKVVLIINHLFRAAMMVGFMFIPGIPQYIGMPMCFVGSVFYRLTVEKNCAYKFALPSFAGAAAFMIALPSIIHMIHGGAFASFAVGALTCASLLPLLLYASYILLTVSYEVDKTLGLLPNNEAEKCHCPTDESSS